MSASLRFVKYAVKRLLRMASASLVTPRPAQTAGPVPCVSKAISSTHPAAHAPKKIQVLRPADFIKGLAVQDTQQSFTLKADSVFERHAKNRSSRRKEALIS
jgi:hypothetical protein